MEATGEGHDSDSSLTWEDFFGSTTAEDLVPTLLSMYDTLVGRTRPPEAQQVAPVSRPLSQASIASSCSSSSSGNGSMCERQQRKAYLASIESLDDSEEEVLSRSSPSKAGSQGSEDSGVCSPRSYMSSSESRSLLNRPRRCESQPSYIDRVVLEILHTEQLYVEDLSQVIHGYIENLENSPDCPVPRSKLAELFGNIRQIYSFNSTFLHELEDCGTDPVKVARVFVKNNSGFSVYTDYCTNYPRAVQVLTELMRIEEVVRLFRERQISLAHTLPLGSYLLKPVQRILKYHLLLQNMVKSCEREDEGSPDVVTALSTMTGIAHHINDMKRKHEHAVRVQEIQSLLLGWQGEDLTRYGELCAEGTFRMAGAKALRHAFLFDQILLITKKKAEGILQYKAHILCSNLMLIESIAGEPLCFHVIPFDNPRHQYTLQARSLEQKREWTLQLKRVILENYNAVIPSHARQLVMELGQISSQDESVGERSAPKRQHSAPEYLERRKQERRKSEAGFIRGRLRTRSRKLDLSPSSLICKDKLGGRRRSLNRREDSHHLPSTDDKSDMSGSREGCFPSESLTEASSEAGSLDLHISEEEEPREEKKKTVEEIVSQLLMQNKEFQRVLQKQRHISSRRARVETSDEEEDILSRSSQSLQQEGDYDNLWTELKRTRSFMSEREDRSIEMSLSVSEASFDGPTCPAVWLKQQRQHLVTPTSHKAGSLPRGFQLGTPDWHRTRISPDRPFTIASDKAQQELNLEDMERYAESQHTNRLARHRFPLPDDTEDESTPDASSQDLVHPEHKIYRSSLTKATIKQVISSVSNKLANLRLSSETLDQIDYDYRASRLKQAFTKTFKPKKENEKILPVYKQGSSALGARIAHGLETSDYADPRTLFPTITSSKKAASLLGIRPYSAHSLTPDLSMPLTPEASKVSPLKHEECPESDGSADSFYERTFEAIESTMVGDVCRDSAVFSDPDDLSDHSLAKTSSSKKVPPPIPDKPARLKGSWRYSSPLCSPDSEAGQNGKFEDECDSSSVASTVIDTTTTNKGWVRHVICKIQGDQSF